MTIIVILIIAVVIYYYVSGSDKKEAKTKANRALMADYKAQGLNDQDIKIFRETLKSAKADIMAWEAAVKKDQELALVEEVTSGLTASKKLFKWLVKHPHDMNKEEAYLYKYLPNMVKLAHRHIEMQAVNVLSKEMEADKSEVLLTYRQTSEKVAKRYHDILIDDFDEIKAEVDHD